MTDFGDITRTKPSPEATSPKLAIGGPRAIKHALPPTYPGGMRIGAEEEKAAVDVLRSKRLFRYYGTNPGGSKVEDFEKTFADYPGTYHAVAVSSGTASLVCGLAALGVGPGDEVIVSAYTWIGSAEAAVRELVAVAGATCDQIDQTPNPPGIAMHESGTARMGSDPTNSVLDPHNQCWEADGLYVTDGACFPSQGYQNPTLTIPALTARACDHAVQAARSGSVRNLVKLGASQAYSG